MRAEYRIGFGAIAGIGLFAAYFALREGPKMAAPGVDARRMERKPAVSVESAARRRSARDATDAAQAESDRRRRAAAGTVRAPDTLERRSSNTADSESTQQQPDPRKSLPIFLDALELAPGFPTVALSGLDPWAPRDLVAWRVKDGRRAIIARGSSDPDGQLNFPELIAPRDGLEIVVTDATSAPGIPGASISRKLAGRNPAAPNVVVTDADGSDYFIRIVPAEFSGRVLLADINGTVFAEYPVSSVPSAVARIIDVALNVAPGESALLSAHQFADGRRSEWREISLDVAGFGGDPGGS